MGNGLERNEVDFEVNAGPGREPMETTNHLHDAGVHINFGNSMYNVPGGLSPKVCKRVLYSLQILEVSVVYTIKNGVEVVNTASDFCNRYGGVLVKMLANALKLAHVVVATLYDRVDLRDKVKI